jgi:hypothetical protein
MATRHMIEQVATLTGITVRLVSGRRWSGLATGRQATAAA